MGRRWRSDVCTCRIQVRFTSSNLFSVTQIILQLKTTEKKCVQCTVKVTTIIDSYPEEDYAFVFTDGYSDEDGGVGINFTFPPDNRTKYFKVGVGKLASNNTCDLLAILTALSDCKAALQATHKGHLGLITNIHYTLRQLLSLKKQCILQWIPAHVGIDENEAAVTLAKEARQLNSNANTATLVTLTDINSVAKNQDFSIEK
ncbi:RNase H domain-containing protein [Trichonephila clavipes]|nr:RNase H domain-containing protein [Trichonephila clavipes]